MHYFRFCSDNIIIYVSARLELTKVGEWVGRYVSAIDLKY